MYSLNNVLQEIGVSVEEGAGKIIGGEIANLTTDAQKGVSSKLPDWLNNIFSGVVSGFSSTPGGAKAISDAGTSALQSNIKGFFSTPAGWITIAISVFLIVIIFFKGKK